MAANDGVSSRQTRSVATIFMSERRSSCFARRAEEGKRDDFGGDGVADGFDGHFHVKRGAGGRVIAADAGERNHFLESR